MNHFLEILKAAETEAVPGIFKITSGQIDNKTAASMLRVKRSEIKKLFK